MPRNRTFRPALLLDLDGTMVDTDVLHIAAWNTVLAQLDRQIDTHTYKTRVMGFDNESVTRALLPEHSASARSAFASAKEEAFRASITQLVPARGLPELLGWAEDLAIPVAVVTNAPRDNATLMLAGLGWEDRFPTLVIGDELARAKPDPLPYITALEKLGADAATAVAFEDSLSGVRAAAGAGVATVGMLTSLADEVLRQAGAILTAKDFTDTAVLRFLKENLQP